VCLTDEVKCSSPVASDPDAAWAGALGTTHYKPETAYEIVILTAAQPR
jgi:hypothetical protein